jgi:hypothetical protein
MEGLKGKTVLLVTHQVDFLPAFDFVLVITNYIHLKAMIMLSLSCCRIVAHILYPTVFICSHIMWLIWNHGHIRPKFAFTNKLPIVAS